MLPTGVHRRINPLRGSWILCSPHSADRPWQGDQEPKSRGETAVYDPQCFLCPGNKRASGETNQYDSVYVFPNDFAALNPREGQAREKSGSIDCEGDLFVSQPVYGQCSVICYSPRHDKTMADMTPEEIYGVIEAWKQVYQAAQSDPQAAYCQIFENKGRAMGCSNPHPHGQAWSLSVVPDEPQLEHECLVKYYKHHGTHMLVDYVAKELAVQRKGGNINHRIVDCNDTFVLLVPYWATWPFETMIVSRERIPSLQELDSKRQCDLAHILSSLTTRYDNLFETSFPYSMGIHQRFVGGDFAGGKFVGDNNADGTATGSGSERETDVEHLHFHFYPPLLRSATVRKFLVGFEMLGMPQRDVTPEMAAKALRECSAEHS